MKWFLVFFSVIVLGACSSSPTRDSSESKVSCQETCQEQGLVVDKSFVNVCACKLSKDGEEIQKLQQRLELVEKMLEIEKPVEEPESCSSGDNSVKSEVISLDPIGELPKEEKSPEEVKEEPVKENETPE